MEKTAKNKLAFVLGSTGNMAFAVANVLMGVVKNYNKSNFDVIIYCDENFAGEDKRLLNTIHKCEFIKYDFFEGNTEKFDQNILNRFTSLAFSRYECFNLLEKYEKVVWLDIDLLIKGEINGLIESCKTGIALYCKDGILGNEFSKPVENYDMARESFNSGVIVLSENLKNPDEISKWCYEKTIEYAEYLKCPDQAIINLAIQEFNLNVTVLADEYNCHPDYPDSDKAKILHPFCMEKFWNFYNYKEWNDNYKKWLKMGGSAYKGKVFNILEKTVINFKKKYALRAAPDPIRHTRKFLMYVINSKLGSYGK